MSDRSSRSEKNLPINVILPATALIVIESENSLPRTVFLNKKSIIAKLSTVLLEPDSVLVVSIVISMTSLTLASITAPAEIFKLSVISRNRTMSLMLLPRFITLPVNMLIVIESENSLDAENCFDEESASDNESEDILFPASSLDNESSSDNISVELLDPENNLVVSIVNKIMSEGFLMAMNNLDDESDPVKMSDVDLDPENNLSTPSKGFIISVDSLISDPSLIR